MTNYGETVTMSSNLAPEPQHKLTVQAAGGACHRTENLTHCVDVRNVVLNTATGICAIKRMDKLVAVLLRG